MTSAADELAAYAVPLSDPLCTQLPEAEFVVAPRTAEEAAGILAVASQSRLRVLVWGGGTHQGYGYDVADVDIVLVTTRMSRIIDWQPDDLTLVVEGGARLADVLTTLEARRQTPVLTEHAGNATVGGVVAAGVSGYSRLRHGPTRDRILEVVIATGDGRVVTAGGRLVKNVTGYDLPRLATGSLGALGVIISICIKLWPRPIAEATVAVDDAAAAVGSVYRPFAVVETEQAAWAYIGGTEEEIHTQASVLGGRAIEGLQWPDPLSESNVLVLRVPARLTADAVRRVGRLDGASFRASHGVGEIRIGLNVVEATSILELRVWAESVGGALVVTRRPGPALIDPWGRPPDSVELQRRVKAAFDPFGIVNPGRLPGGI